MTYAYWNLNRDIWSLMERGLVVDHQERVRLMACEFRVREGGRQRVLRERRKSVHAFVVGEVVERGGKALEPIRPGTLVRYDPYEGPHFIEAETGRPVARAGVVELTPDRKVLAWDLEFLDPS